MKSWIKNTIIVTLICAMTVSLAGCSLFDSKAKVYSRYVTSLLDVNYKNISKDYVTLTGVTQKDAEAVFEDNMNYQAHNLMNYYGVKEVDDGTVLSEFYYLAQSIFANAKYEVTDVKKDKDSDTYTLTLTVYPLDTLDACYDQIVEYIEGFDARVDDGDFNNTTEVDYETEFAEGIIDILKKATENPGYMDPVVIEVPIQPSEDSYFIADEDFMKINSAILYIREDATATTEAADTSSEVTKDAGDATEAATDASVSTEAATEAVSTEAASEAAAQ